MQVFWGWKLFVATVCLTKQEFIPELRSSSDFSSRQEFDKNHMIMPSAHAAAIKKIWSYITSLLASFFSLSDRNGSNILLSPENLRLFKTLDLAIGSPKSTLLELSLHHPSSTIYYVLPISYELWTLSFNTSLILAFVFLPLLSFGYVT